MKTTLVIFEGIDGAGKTTLQHEFAKTHINALTIDRFYASRWVYNELYGRPQFRDNSTFEHALAKQFKPLVVWLVVDPAIAKQRQPENDVLVLDLTQKLFSEFFATRKVLKLDTGIRTVSECIAEIDKHL